MMDSSIDEIDSLRLANERKIEEIQRTNHQLVKALEVNENIWGVVLMLQSLVLDHSKNSGFERTT